MGNKLVLGGAASYIGTLRWAVGAGVHLLLAAGSSAQDDVARLRPDVDNRVVVQAAVVAPQRAIVRQGAAVNVMAAQDAEGFHLPPEVVNQWIFGGNLQPDDGRKRLEQQLQLRLEEMTNYCHLTPEQLGTLRRAGRGDVVRFLRKVGDVQKMVSGKVNNVNMAQLINDHVQPLQLALQSGSFGDDSLFHKTAARVLEPDQQQLFRELTETRRKAIFRTRVELALGLLERQIPLLDDQRNQLLELILSRTPPATWGRGDLDLLWVQYQISILPDATLDDIFSEPQRQMLSAYFRRMGNQRQLLIERGLLDDQTK